MAGGRRIEVSFAVIVAVSFIVLAAFSYAIRENRHNARQGRDAHDALCIVRSKIVRDIAKGAAKVHRSEAFLVDHPRGIPGIPAKLIRAGIADDKASLQSDRGTLEALRVLDCVPPPKPKETS